MEEIIKTIIVYAGAAGAIYVAFDRLENLAAENLRERVLLFLKDHIKDRPTEQFSSLLDRLFGSKHFSWRCFVISSLVSLLAVFSIFGGLFLLEVGAEPQAPLIICVIFGALLANVIPDYLSLVESRVIIRWLPKFGVFGKGVLLLIDLIITSVIYMTFLGGYIVGSVIFIHTSVGLFLSVVFYGAEVPREVPRIVLATFLSTFTTSLWIYFYLLGIGTTKVTLKFNIGKNMLKLLKWESQPVRAVGGLLAVYLFGLLCFIHVGFWLFR